ncbi:MAG: galactose mutarotase [Clostridiales bacterium]|nr:galactose mutarotase [Clostridiales bacterium]
MVKQETFGHVNGKEVRVFTLTSDTLCVRVMELGASIQSLKMKTAHGEKELTLGYDTVDEYMVGKPSYYGASIGRVANRIGDAKFSLGGKTYTLTANNASNCLHGGFDGYDRRIFAGKSVGDNAVAFTLNSPDGDQGFPAALTLTVTYTLNGNELSVKYAAVSDADTLFAPTNHAFFNFDDGAPVYDTELTIYASAYTPVNEKLLPTGEARAVKGTPFDFTVSKKIGKDIHAQDEQLDTVGGGFDHNYVLDGTHAATAVGKKAGVKMDLYCDLPSMQFYSGNFLENERCRYGVLKKHTAFCLEPQFFPNAVNTPAFETPLLKAGEEKAYTFRYVFNTLD